MGRLISLVDCLRSSPSEDGDEINPKEVDRDFSEGAHDGGNEEGGQENGQRDGQYWRGGG